MLEKNDLKQIKKIVNDSSEKIKDEIITTINREISDLADINRAVITKTVAEFTI